ncbi:hypothetical protein [Scytonema sp. NUACC26]|uniref:hypothetical protein n=1 Tax=Scytonema sp. NUACC26 TaxID=3140176 RepID=UPI0038B2A590
MSVVGCCCLLWDAVVCCGMLLSVVVRASSPSYVSDGLEARTTRNFGRILQEILGEFYKKFWENCRLTSFLIEFLLIIR